MVNTLRTNHMIRFYDWSDGWHEGKVKEILTLHDDFGEFYLVTVAFKSSEAQITIEDFNGLLIGSK